mgnify:CR=1 FL=1
MNRRRIDSEIAVITPRLLSDWLFRLLPDPLPMVSCFS